jgi:hypothetical protein
MDKKKATLDVLNSLNISNLKGKREQERQRVQEEEQAAASFLDPEEPGIAPEEAAKRRSLLLEADPSMIKKMEEKPETFTPAGPILDMPLSEILKKRKKKEPLPADMGDEADAPINVAGDY